MNEEEIVRGSWPSSGRFIDDAGGDVGTFTGMLATEGVFVSGHGYGGYTPTNDGPVRFVEKDRSPLLIDSAHIRHGVITFRAWHLHP